MSYDGNQVVAWSECPWRPDGSHRNSMGDAVNFAMQRAADRARAELRRRLGENPNLTAYRNPSSSWLGAPMTPPDGYTWHLITRKRDQK